MTANFFNLLKVRKKTGSGKLLLELFPPNNLLKYFGLCCGSRPVFVYKIQGISLCPEILYEIEGGKFEFVCERILCRVISVKR
jgi:hypothetical protein